MKLPFSLTKTAPKQNRAISFLLKMLFILCLLKIAFFGWNFSVTNGWAIKDANNFFSIIKWSLIYDVFTVAVINLPLLLLLWCNNSFLRNKIVNNILIVTCAVANTVCLFLNAVDIFYFRFHLQRADADLLYVLRNPFDGGTLKTLVVFILCILFLVIVFAIITKAIKKITTDNRSLLIATCISVCIAALFFITNTKKILPAYPLTKLKTIQLPLTQNSLHTFLYSLYRSKEEIIPGKIYMSEVEAASLLQLNKKNYSHPAKNIVLFIMESVPYDFFDSSSINKVKMPFLDSLVNKSTFFTNAFSYAYTSNKGITAILAGLPTTTDIPLYHSTFINIDKTTIGEELAKKNYTSSFFIGDNYDDFGFAKCCNWLGIQQYYCMKDIPGYIQIEKHSMGLHDEYVLNFMEQKMENQQQPFFNVMYNISTHYPNDLPAGFKDLYPSVNRTPPMKSMAYYDQCLQQFFNKAKQQPWFNNTVFIFCSDHWATPRRDSVSIDVVESFRIPIFIYEASNETRSVINSPVSQLDIMNTILFYSDYTNNIRSYGYNLMDTTNKNRTVFTKTNTSIYQAINNQFVLGFDATEGKPLYCYNYKTDKQKENDLLKQAGFTKADTMILQMKACLQTLYKQYKKINTN